MDAPNSQHIIRVDCAGRRGEEVLAKLREALAKAAARRSRPVIVLLHLARLGDSLMALFRELTALVMRTEPRPVLVDGSRYAATFFENVPGAVPIVVCEDEPAAAAPRHVLVVEDSVDILEFLCHLIRSAGHQAFGAGSVAGAVDVLDRERVDLIFLDLKLPDGHGSEVVRQARARGLEIPVVAVSGLPLDPEDSRRFGIRRTIAKPLHVREVLNALQD